MKNNIGKILVSMGQILLMVLVLSLISCGSTPEGDSSQGKSWFSMQHCTSCHGDDGSGKNAVPKVKPTDMSYRAFLSKLRKSKSTSMPSFSKEELSDQKVADIFSYLQEEK